MTDEEREKTLWEVMYATLFDSNVRLIRDRALMNCLIILKGYLVEMLEAIKDDQ
jgi:hypothetical protein